ncbi:MAG: ABA4-like family protein [Hyphomicrobiaceae bacterium]|nr:ABA4-like family protein [Hyphomicrobiaceae bacterium]
MNDATLEVIFLVANTAVLPAWLLLASAPAGGVTRRLVHSGLVPATLAVLYVVLLATAIGAGAIPSDADVTSLSGIRSLLASPIAALAGWVHYLCFDLLAGAWIASDRLARGGGRAALAPILFLTLMAGPLGLLVHVLTRGAHTTPPRL